MSRFIDLAETDRLDLGACQCDGTPHPSDWVEYQKRASYEDLILLGRAANEEPLLLRRAIRAWNLADAAGDPVAVSEEAIAQLDPLTSGAIYQAISQAWLAAVGLPNASGARSRGSSRASASPRPSSKRPTPTTS